MRSVHSIEEALLQELQFCCVTFPLSLSLLILQFSSAQSLSRVQLSATPRTAARQGSLSTTSSRSVLKLLSIESVMPSNHLILCRPFFLLPLIFPSIRPLILKMGIIIYIFPLFRKFQLINGCEHSLIMHCFLRGVDTLYHSSKAQWWS